jgi:radical SAM superfamily enzyme YgiQ (UPF0313 family)
MPAFTIIDPVARSLEKFPLGCEIVLSLVKETGWEADKTITDLRDKSRKIELKRNYNMIGMSLYYPLQYLNIVPILKKLSLPPRWADRGKRAPIICAGGASVTMNPFPVCDFFDFILLGDAEGVLPEILQLRKELSKDRFLKRLSLWFPCVFVPKYPRESYTVNYTTDISRGLFPPEHGRQPKIELARGCKFSCSFCLQGAIPYRENRLDSVKKVLSLYSGRRVMLGANAPCSYRGISELLDFCIDKKVMPTGFSFRLSSLTEAILKKMKKLKMVSTNVGIEGYSERLRRILRKGLRTDSVIKKVCLIARYIPIISLNFISHLPSVNIADVMQFFDMMEVILEQRDKEGLNVGYDLTVTPFVPRPHTVLELVPYCEEKVEAAAESVRMGLIEKYGGMGTKFGSSNQRRKMEMLLTRGDATFGKLFPELYDRYPSFYFHQSFNRKIFDYFSLNLDVDYWLSNEVDPHWRRISW